MSKILRAATRTRKVAVNFNVRIIIHRLNISWKVLEDQNDGLYLALSRGKKQKLQTKMAPLQSCGEVLWDEDLKMECTLYMDKTSNNFQSKVFHMEVLTQTNNRHVAHFELDISTYVNKKNSKNCVILPALKCADSAALLSVTLFCTEEQDPGPRRRSEPLSTCQNAEKDKSDRDDTKTTTQIIATSSSKERIDEPLKNYKDENDSSENNTDFSVKSCSLTVSMATPLIKPLPNPFEVNTRLDNNHVTEISEDCIQKPTEVSTNPFITCLVNEKGNECGDDNSNREMDLTNKDRRSSASSTASLNPFCIEIEQALSKTSDPLSNVNAKDNEEHNSLKSSIEALPDPLIKCESFGSSLTSGSAYYTNNEDDRTDDENLAEFGNLLSEENGVGIFEREICSLTEENVELQQQLNQSRKSSTDLQASFIEQIKDRDSQIVELTKELRELRLRTKNDGSKHEQPNEVDIEEERNYLQTELIQAKLLLAQSNEKYNNLFDRYKKMEKQYLDFKLRSAELALT